MLEEIHERFLMAYRSDTLRIRELTYIDVIRHIWFLSSLNLDCLLLQPILHDRFVYSFDCLNHDPDSESPQIHDHASKKDSYQ